MSTEQTEKNSIFVRVDTELKRKSKSNAALHGIGFQDYITLALNHFNDHIEKDDIEIDASVFDNIDKS